MKFLFFENARNQFAGVAMAIFHGVDQRQRDFAFFQIAEHRLAELFGGSGEIQQIIHQLKCQAGVAAVVGERFFLFAARGRREPRRGARSR